jgi:outer membrane protein assembly factor BamB
MNMRLNWTCSLLCLAGFACYLCGCVPPPERSGSGSSTSTNTTYAGNTTTSVYYEATEPDTSSDEDTLPVYQAEVETPAVDTPETTADAPAVDSPADADATDADASDESVTDEPTIELMPPEPSTADEAASAESTEQAEPAVEASAEPEAAAPMEAENAAAPEGDAAEAAPAAESAAEAVAEPEAAAEPPAGDRTVAGDWPMWGGTINRNMVNATTGVSLDFEPAEDAAEGQKVLWTAKLGSQTYGNPVVAGGKVFVGTNNGGEYRPQHTGDKGCVLCFDEKSGEFLWQLTRDKLPQGRVNDWPEQGICSTVCVEGDRAWVVTNRCELMCLDVEGFRDGENDGPYQDETDAEEQDADIIWNLDMIEELGVFPHNLATSSPVIYGDMVYITTSNGVDEAHLEIPSPRSPSFLAVNKTTGEIVWEDNTPFDLILHGQWSSPAIGVVDGKPQVYMPGGDGWLYAFDGLSGDLIWKFDLNPKDSKWELGGRGSRNSIIATPVFLDNSVVLAVGQDPEHGEGLGHAYRIDATKKGDVSPVTEDGQPNPNSGQIWHLGGIDEDGSQTGEEGAEAFRRTLSTAAISNGLVYLPDLSGRIHCIDFETGRRYWEADVLAAIWGSCMVVDGKVFVGDEDGIMTVFEEGKELKKLAEFEFNSSIYSTPTIANGVMYVSDRSRLYAIGMK